jgi:citrate lyase subunit beta-like protein
LIVFLGATRTEAGTELLYARQSVVAHAKAFNLQAIDIVRINYKDIEALKREATEGAIMGFTGKQIIHPLQVRNTDASHIELDSPQPRLLSG